MRMPGWDGLTTIQQIREVDVRSEVIFVTAFSDNNIDDIVSRAGAKVSYFASRLLRRKLGRWRPRRCSNGTRVVAWRN